MYTCLECNIEKEVGQFRIARTGLGHTKKCKKCLAEYDRKRNWSLKLEMISVYGGECACCGEKNPKFLALDHINGDGAEKRRNGEHTAGTNFYLFLKRLGFPQLGFRILCHNCNMAIGMYGICPHKEEV